VIIHTLDKLGKVFVNIFSCKEFNSKEATTFTANWFSGMVVKEIEVERI
jgi:hypothetical protein